METRNYWEESGHAVKYDNYNPNEEFGRSEALHFAPPSEDEAEYSTSTYLKKGKVSRQDPMSHRIIEKRRRDRMNNCLADLSRLIPPEYLKKGRGRVEKTEIIEMAIRHLKYMQERTNAGGNQGGEEFRAGYQEAVAEAVKFLAEQGYSSGEGLCVQLASRLQRHCEHLTKGEIPREKQRQSHNGSSSETTSSSGSSHGFSGKPPAAVQPPRPPYTYPQESYEEQLYPMECDRVSAQQISMATESDAMEPSSLPLDGRRKRDLTLRAVRKPENNEEYLHSYKFKNSIERRFSRSLDTETLDSHSHGVKVLTHKRRRIAKPVPSTSTSNSGSTEETRDTSPQDTSSESPHNHYEKPAAVSPSQYVPIFALNSLGKHYVPLSVDYACLSRALGPYDALDARGGHLAVPLHPVTIHVNFQPCMDYHVKREPTERDWRPT